MIGMIILCICTAICFKFVFWMIEYEKCRQILEQWDEDEKCKEENYKAWQEDQRRTDEWYRQQQKMFRQEHTRQECLQNSMNREYQNALALYMLKEPYTQQDVSRQRKRLMKGFHSDTDGGCSDEYAKRINSSYDILIRNLAKESEI